MQGDFRIGSWLIQPQLHTISRGAQATHVEPKAMQVLVYLSEHTDDVVTKERLIAAVWTDTFVTEDVLTRCISELRKAFGDDARNPQVIETIPRGGYRLILLPRRIPSFRREWVLTLAVLGICVGVLAWIYLRPAPRPPLIVVLPVQNLTGDATREYVADGLTEELIARLGSLGSDKLSVIARTSAMSYKNSTKTVAQVTRELGVNYVIESSVRQWGDRVRITAQLIRARDESHLWVRDYDSSGQDFLTIEEEIARDVANEIEFRLTATPAKPPRLTHPIRREAYESYLQGRYFWARRGLANFQKAIAYFQQAIQVDPEYAAAYAGLADAYGDQGFWGGTPNEAMPKARAAALRALELDDSSSEAHDALAGIADAYDWDWKKGETEHRRAIELNPNNAAAHLQYASHLVDVGQREKAREEVRKAQSLDPLSPFFRAAGGLMLYLAGYREEGIQQNLKAIELAPDFLVPHLALSQFYFEMGNYDLGILEYEKGSRLAGMRPDTLAALLDSYKSQGISGFRREQLKLTEKSLLQLDSFSLAVIHAGLGEKEKAIQYLQQNVEEHGPRLQWIGADRSFDSLRGEPGFQAILRELHLRQ